MGIDCGGADDEDDPPCVTERNDVWMWKPRVEQVQSCVQQLSPFSCLVLHQRLDVTFFRAHPDSYTKGNI